MSTHCLYTWAEGLEDVINRFTDQRHVDRHKFMDDSAHRGCLWSCYSTTFGASIHEMGHILDLGHSTHGIMSLDYNNIESFFIITKLNLLKEIKKWWTSSEIYILSHHKWINDKNRELKEKKLSLVNNYFIKSYFGIVVIEYRNSMNNQIIYSEVFTLLYKIV